MNEQVINQIRKQADNIPALGASIKFVLDDNPLYIDGNGEKNVITTEDKDADCVIITTSETIMKLKNGELNPMMAVMGGKIKIKGDMGLAMKLQSLI